MTSAVEAFVHPGHGLKVKNTFIDVDASDEEEGPSRSRRGFLTMPDMPDRTVSDAFGGVGDAGTLEQQCLEPSPAAAWGSEPAAAKQPGSAEPTLVGHPTLLRSLQRAAAAELPDPSRTAKVVVKNTFI
eukprot:CAMPEP_0171253030 /NCGR_PEP_ID=MMETSP0790-20130122/51488_1 /TAXON_ID=2925 /ORGANISM="Alexandrium catenella, Strain OF101" /LENGTH=128 /DNA_ID=CAMNT_0011720833 /DNA_START=114 /DNA_END=497 /DNA_ORIENTATION=+